MLKALRFSGWPLLAGVLVALLIIQRYPEWVGLPSLDVNLQQAPQTKALQQGPVSYADAVTIAAPAVVNLYTTKVVNKSSHPLFEDPQFRRFFGDNDIGRCRGNGLFQSVGLDSRRHRHAVVALEHLQEGDNDLHGFRPLRFAAASL